VSSRRARLRRPRRELGSMLLEFARFPRLLTRSDLHRQCCHYGNGLEPSSTDPPCPQALGCFGLFGDEREHDIAHECVAGVHMMRRVTRQNLATTCCEAEMCQRDPSSNFGVEGKIAPLVA
jgi:hypothetical protein